MGLIIFLLILAFPAAEIYVLIKVGEAIGFWDTLLLLIFSAMFGVYLAKHQGMSVLTKIQQCLAQGQVPAREMLDGILIFAGGVLFIIPGFISDGLGLLFIFPPTRWLISWGLSRRLKVDTGRRQQAASRSPRQETGEKTSFPASGRGPVQDAEVL